MFVESESSCLAVLVLCWQKPHCNFRKGIGLIERSLLFTSTSYVWFIFSTFVIKASCLGSALAEANRGQKVT